MEQQLDNLTNYGMIDAMLLDWSAFSLKHHVWNNHHELWRKWIRSN